MLYLVTFYFTVQKIEVTQKGKPVALNGLKGLEGDRMILLDEKKTADTVLLLNPYLKTITVQKQYPQTLLITVDNHIPLAQLQGDVGYYILSDTAKILEKKRYAVPNLPLISYYQKLPFIQNQAGKFIDFQDIELALHFIKKVRSAGIAVETVDIAGFHMIRLNSKDKTILVSAEKDKETQDYQFETIVRELRKDGNDFSELDLRFEKPIFKQVEKK